MNGTPRDEPSTTSNRCGMASARAPAFPSTGPAAAVYPAKASGSEIVAVTIQ
jgi:hypothetical protein